MLSLTSPPWHLSLPSRNPCSRVYSLQWDQSSGGGVSSDLVPHLHFVSEEAGVQGGKPPAPWSRGVLEAQQESDSGLLPECL